jgi:DNA-binding winged helix-turn-helix (wHTH) protein
MILPMGDALFTVLENHTINVLVSRLRRKAQHVGIDLPLRTVRGYGYLFAESLNLSTTEMAPKMLTKESKTTRRNEYVT